VASAPELSRSGRAYVRTVSALGLLVIGFSLYKLYQSPVEPQWLLLAALTLISGSASVKLAWANVSISISEAFVFTAVLLYGPSAGTLTVALDALVISFWIAKRRPQLDRALFNIAAPALSAWCSSQIFFSVSGISALSETADSITAPIKPAPLQLDAILPSLALFALTYFALNSWLIAIVIALEKKQNPWVVWRKGLLWLSLNYFCGASVAVLLVGYSRTVDVRFVAVVLPLLLVLYFTFRTSMQRVQDATRHVDELNALYLSTIETLAMAIDAKDQVTHGHIRRVQVHATSLARHVGVRDQGLIKAIEAAALLHDMGKLAVPEHILNKPGKLTDTEFERMKMHASVGADILSAIDFPYPVVPIVRHHHENWDGSGYPAGLRRTDIPIGARILAVVDCFDALTSDRPYRPKLPDQDAIRILLDRRGTMYDPLIVDTFVRIQQTTPQDSRIPDQASTVLKTIAHSRNTARIERREPADERTSSADEMLSVYGLTAALAGRASISDACDVIAKHLQRLIPSATCVFYMYDAKNDELRAEHVFGESAARIAGCCIGLGQRLSGWVGANRQTICNSDAALDLDGFIKPPLRFKNCLSTPLVSNDDLIGVVTLYGTDSHSFNDDHRRIIEVVARQIAHTFHRAIQLGSASRRDSLTGLPHAEQLEHLIASISDSEALDQRHSLLFIDVGNLKSINSEHGRAAGDEAIRHVVRHVRAGLRIADILFRNSGDDFVAFLGATDSHTADAVGARIRDLLKRNPAVVVGNTVIGIDTTVTAAASPTDGFGLRELLTVARQRRAVQRSPQDGPRVH